MVQEILVGIAVFFGFILGPLLGNWTKDEAIKLKKAVRRFKKLIWLDTMFYAVFLYLGFKYGFEILASLLSFGLIITETSLFYSKKLDKGAIKQGILFLVLFSALVLIMGI